MPTKNISASIDIRTSARATLSGEQSRTGRKVVADENYGMVSAWAKHPNRSGSELESQFLSILTDQPTLPNDHRVCYRGRYYPDADDPRPFDFGPPPTDTPNANRYNADSVKVLYLSGSLTGIARELNDVGAVWAQKFCLPSSLRIADFRVGGEDDLISEIFWITENAEEEENGYPYHFGQYVARLVSKQFDGMAVPGVRGDSSERYFNVVMLNRIEEWQDWLSPTRRPTSVR